MKPSRAALLYLWALLGWPFSLFLHAMWVLGQWDLFKDSLSDGDITIFKVVYVLGNISGIAALLKAGCRRWLVFVYGVIAFTPAAILLLNGILRAKP